MPAAKRSHRSANPLRELRRLLGTETKLLSTDRLGALVAIPAATLRSVEIGRRTFNPDLQKRMRARGLNWDSATKKWFFTFNRDANLSLYLLESVRRLTRGDARSQKDDRECLCKRLTALLEHVSNSAYTDLRLDLDSAFEELLERYQIEEAKPVFQHTALKIEMLKTPSGGQVLKKSRSGPMGLADQAEPTLPEAQEFGLSQKDAA
jgi:hypothetical protein